MVLQDWYTVDTTRDEGFTAGLARAAALLRPGYAAAVQAAASGPPDAQWQDWAHHQVTTTVTVTPSPEDHPPDTATTAYRSAVVTVTPVGRDGWRGPPQLLVAYLRLARTDRGWAVDHIDLH